MTSDSKRRWGPTYIDGTPRTYGDTSISNRWREPVARKLLAEWGKMQLDVPVRLTIRFFLTGERLDGGSLDLTGLLESTVNAVAHVVFAPRHGGRSKWDHRDDLVFEIAASKVVGGDRRAGAEILLEEL